MTHTMTEEEYAQYLEDKKEAEEYRHWKEKLPERVQRYFDGVKFKIKTFYGSNLHPLVFTECRQTKEYKGYRYCDMCPVIMIAGRCPLGHRVEFSK